MDIFNFAKAVEQGVYDVMMWIFFYPYTLLRMLVAPLPMLSYVQIESAGDPETAFASAMRPALFLFISITIGTTFAPLNAEQVAQMQTSPLGRLLTESWFALLFFRMVAFSLFPLAGAVILGILTPGLITKDSLHTPFYQQCYICAPLALIVSPALVIPEDSMTEAFAGAVFAVLIWFLVCQFLFFRRFGGFKRRYAVLLAPAVMMVGVAGMLSMAILF